MDDIQNIDLDYIFDKDGNYKNYFKLSDNIKKIKLIRTKNIPLKIGINFLREANITHLYTNNLINVTEIGDNFLCDCKNLIHFDTSGFIDVTQIGNYFMSYCSNLTQFYSSGFINVTQIGNNFLHNCVNLKFFDSSKFINVNKIGDNFMSICCNLTHFDSVGFANVNKIGIYFLNNCCNLTDVDCSGFINVKEFVFVFIDFEKKIYDLWVTRINPKNIKTDLYFLPNCNNIKNIIINSKNGIASNTIINVLKINFPKQIKWLQRNISLLIREHSKNKMYDAFGVWNIMTNVTLYLE